MIQRYIKVYRFPFLANEIFNCEINALLDRFFDAPEKIKKTLSVPTPTTDSLNKKEDEESSSEEEEKEAEKKEEKEEEEQHEESKKSDFPAASTEVRHIYLSNLIVRGTNRSNRREI